MAGNAVLDEEELECTGPELLEQMAMNGECPGEAILRLQAHVAKLEAAISKLLFSPIDGQRTLVMRADYAREAHELIGPGERKEGKP